MKFEHYRERGYSARHFADGITQILHAYSGKVEWCFTDEFVAVGGDLSAMEHKCQLYAENLLGKSTEGIINGNRFRANRHDNDGRVTIEHWNESGGFWESSDSQQLATPELLHRAAKDASGYEEELNALRRSQEEAFDKLKKTRESAERSRAARHFDSVKSEA